MIQIDEIIPDVGGCTYLSSPAALSPASQILPCRQAGFSLFADFSPRKSAQSPSPEIRKNIKTIYRLMYGTQVPYHTGTLVYNAGIIP